MRFCYLIIFLISASVSPLFSNTYEEKLESFFERSSSLLTKSKETILELKEEDIFLNEKYEAISSFLPVDIEKVLNIFSEYLLPEGEGLVLFYAEFSNLDHIVQGDQFTDKPAVQIVLGVVGVVSFFALFIL